MDFFEHIIVGSGPAGVSAAIKLENSSTCIVDVGEKPMADFPHSSLSEALISGKVNGLLGKRWEMLSNLKNSVKYHPKLRAKAVRHVMQGEPYKVIGPEGKILVRGHGSFAAGGMANVWGAQLLRYTEDDLSEAGNWPISASNLSQYYTELEEYIGISGELDDMADFLGATTSLFPPVPSVPVANYMLSKYNLKVGNHGVRGLRIGRP